MKEEYEIKLKCATCGCDDQFDSNEDQSYIKCSFCDREYFGGIEELKELNQYQVDSIKQKIEDELVKDVNETLRSIFKGNKHIKIK